MKTRWYCLFVFALMYSSAHSDIRTLSLGDVSERELSEEETHLYQLTLESGQFAHIAVEQLGVDIVVSVFDPGGKKILEVDNPTGNQGFEEVFFAADTSGAYQIEIKPFVREGADTPAKSGLYKIQIRELLSADEYKQRLEIERARHDATIQWIKEHAISLKGVEPEQGFEDLQPLKQLIGDASLVALGEATHGTREFFQLKHRLLEYLVTEIGFNVFAIEASMPEGFDVNEYVLTGTGDPEKALAGLYFWTWNTEEVLALIQWMRSYNADPDHVRKVKFYGFDMQFPVRPHKIVMNYLRKIDASVANKFGESAVLSLLNNSHSAESFHIASDDGKREALEIVVSTLEKLKENKKAYTDKTGWWSWSEANLHANILAQYLLQSIASSSNVFSINVRDSAMAENIRWIREHEGPDSKIVIWAHNQHICTAKLGNDTPMGSRLRNMYDEELLTFGFMFGQGSFQARAVTKGGELIPFHVKTLSEQSLDATIGAAGHPYAVIDLRELPKSGYVAQWFAEPHETRSVGSGYTNQRSDWYIRKDIAPEFYDVLLYVDETTAARPNPGGTRASFQSLSAPENLGFEFGEIGLIPDRWVADKYLMANFDYEISLSDENPHGGRKCLEIRRSPARHYGESHGHLRQRVDASPYRGKKITFRGAIRAEIEGAENLAFLWLRVLNERLIPKFTAELNDQSDISNKWRLFELSRVIPEEAQQIVLGMSLIGEGRVWFDSFSVELAE